MKNKKAFTLLELTFTVGILATGIIAVMQAFSYSARIAGLSSDITNAAFFSEDKMQELEFKEKLKLIKFEPPGASGIKDKFQWKYALNLEEVLNLYRLDFDITWERLNRQEQIQLNTYLRF